MTYLLDTHALIWALTESAELSDKVRGILQDRGNNIVVSTLSFWEMSIKRSIQKLDLNGASPEDFVVAALESNYDILPLSSDVCSSFYKLSANYHKDPFDRMLIWHALHHKCSLITTDRNIRKYTSEGLQVVW